MRQRDARRNQWSTDAYDRGDTFRMAMSEDEKQRLAVEAPYSKWLGDQFGGLGTEMRSRRLADYNMANGAYTNTMSGVAPSAPAGPASPAPSIPGGIPQGSRYDPTADMARAAQAMQQAAADMPKRKPQLDTTGMGGWGMQ